ncbi:MAG: hypothetical protein R2761_04050 [Acidimicrobiales bacterium]
MSRSRPVVLAAVLAAAGCGLLAGCASRPSEEDLTNSILTATNAADSTVTLSSEQAACIARALLATNLSDTTLSGLAQDFDKPEVLETEADRVRPAVEAAAEQCR